MADDNFNDTENLENDVLGIIVGGDFNRILVRLKKDANVELGDIVVARENNKRYLLEVYDLSYSSQVSQQKLELVSGFNLETQEEAEFFDKELRLYKIAVAKPLAIVENNKIKSAKEIPHLFTKIYKIKFNDVKVLNDTKEGVYIGNLRGTEDEIPIFVDYKKMLTHHVLIPAQTGKGKSNLVKVLIWNLMEKEDVTFFVIDSHDEYFAASKDCGFSLQNHPLSFDKLFYYSSKVQLKKSHPNVISLKVSLFSITPSHLTSLINFTESQVQIMSNVFKRYGKNWIKHLFTLSEEEKNDFGVVDLSYSTLKRRLMYALSLNENGNPVGLFDYIENDSLNDMVNKLENGKSVILDTSSLSGVQELLIAGIVVNKIFNKYVSYKKSDELESKPIISIVIEEAPRVLAKDSLDKHNIFITIAREGRKFKVGLIAITQLASVIPKEILANMNTKIILGLEMAPERRAVIDSSAQDLSELERSIASLDKGEAIISSTFVKFAMPLKIPYFPEYVKKYLNHNQINNKRKIDFNPLDAI